MSRAGYSWQLVLADCAWFVQTALLALLIGTLGDRLFRHPPLGWRYQTPAQRVLSAATQEPGAGAPIATIPLEELQGLLTQPGVIVLDARPHLFYELGHIPGARSLPREELDAYLPSLEPLLRGPGRTVAVYCTDPSCEDGALVARALGSRGIGPVKLFVGGFAEWEAAGAPVEAAP